MNTDENEHTDLMNNKTSQHVSRRRFFSDMARLGILTLMAGLVAMVWSRDQVATAASPATTKSGGSKTGSAKTDACPAPASREDYANCRRCSLRNGCETPAAEKRMQQKVKREANCNYNIPS